MILKTWWQGLKNKPLNIVIPILAILLLFYPGKLWLLSHTGMIILTIITLFLQYFSVRLMQKGKMGILASFFTWLVFYILLRALVELHLDNFDHTKFMVIFLLIVYFLGMFSPPFFILIHYYRLSVIREREWEKSKGKKKKSNYYTLKIVKGVEAKKSVKILVFIIFSFSFITPIALYVGYVLGQIAFYLSIIIILGLLGRPMYRKYFAKATDKDLWKVGRWIILLIIALPVLILYENHEVLNNFKTSTLIISVIVYAVLLGLLVSWLFKKMGYIVTRTKKK